MVGVSCMMWGKTVLPPSPQARRSSALSATTALLSLSSSFSNLTYYVKSVNIGQAPCAARPIPPPLLVSVTSRRRVLERVGGEATRRMTWHRVSFLFSGYNHTWLAPLCLWVDRPPSTHVRRGHPEIASLASWKQRGRGGGRRAALGQKRGEAAASVKLRWSSERIIRRRACQGAGRVRTWHVKFPIHKRK